MHFLGWELFILIGKVVWVRERMDSRHPWEVRRQAPVSLSLSLPLSQVNFNESTDTRDLLSEWATTALECPSYVTTLPVPRTAQRMAPQGAVTTPNCHFRPQKSCFLSSVIAAGSCNHTPPPYPAWSGLPVLTTESKLFGAFSKTKTRVATSSELILGILLLVRSQVASVV